MVRSARAQPFVKAVAIDHADKAAVSALVDCHIDSVVGWTDHSRRTGAADDQVIGNGEIVD
jgi:hypothetical protein